ncbi:MAG: SRPBCC family protein, partial [Bacteroidota bacterium]
ERGYKGTDGEVGSIAWWKGNKDVGEGEQEITELVPNQKVAMQLRFFKPFKATSDAWFTIDPEGDGSNVSWHFHQKFAPPVSIFMMFMNMEKALGADFEKGLSRFQARFE